MFSVPLICSSRGDATVSAITLGLAPGDDAGEDRPVDEEPRQIHGCTGCSALLSGAGLRGRTRRRFRRFDHDLGPDALDAVDDHAIAGPHALQRDTLRLDLLAELDFAVGDLVVVADDVDEFLALIEADRPLGASMRLSKV